MELYSRPATEADVSIVQRIVDTSQLTLDPNEKRMGESEALEVIRGFFDPATTRLLRQAEPEEWQGFLSLNPDSSRKRYYLDIYSLPGIGLYEPALDIALKLAREEHGDFQLWIGAHSKDVEYHEVLSRRNFYLLRRYWIMEVALTEGRDLAQASDPRIREVDLSNDAEVHSCWRVHQDAFSNHFGFMPREYEEWKRMVLRDQEEANTRAWLLSHDGEDVGFMDCDDHLLHEHAGFVSGLGVRHAFHGQGLGEALLRHAIKVYREAGREKLLLSVDTGNESGALRLYEKVGMKPVSEWHQYENVNWSSEVGAV